MGTDGSIYVRSSDSNICAISSSSGGPLPHLQVGSLDNIADTSSSKSMIQLLVSVIASVGVLVALLSCITYRFYHSYHKMKDLNDRDFDISSSTNTDDEFFLNNSESMDEEK